MFPSNGPAQSLIDLAGSEKATSDKERTREGKYINTRSVLSTSTHLRDRSDAGYAHLKLAHTGERDFDVGRKRRQGQKVIPLERISSHILTDEDANQ